jgi:hypothetical protein
MKITFGLCAAISLLFLGCGEKSDTANPSAGSSTNSGGVLTAPADYLQAAGNAKKSAEKTIDTVSINKAIQMFNVSEGRYPKDLQELVDGKYMPSIPEAPYGMKIEYDATKGEVKVVKQ